MKKYKQEVDKFGNTVWYCDGKFHREDGPAILYFDGSEEWYIDGLLHRVDGPAVTFASGEQYWYVRDRMYQDITKFCDAAKITDAARTMFVLRYSGQFRK